jgi:hypothetical protein
MAALYTLDLVVTRKASACAAMIFVNSSIKFDAMKVRNIKNISPVYISPKILHDEGSHRIYSSFFVISQIVSFSNNTLALFCWVERSLPHVVAGTLHS